MSADVAVVQKCPCNDALCRKYVVPPLFSRPEDSVSKERADEIAAHWNATADLLALAKQVASECGGCDGKGVVEFSDDLVNAGDPCPECADIRAVLNKAEPQP